jgi:cytochrome P450
MRHEEPIQRLDFSTMPGEEGKPVFFVYRHDDIQTMLKDNETFSSSIIKDFFGIGKHVMVGMDEPEHGRHRALVAKAFSPKALAHWEAILVQRIGSHIIDDFASRGSADLVKEFTFPYPTRVIAGLLGLPDGDFPQSSDGRFRCCPT